MININFFKSNIYMYLCKLCCNNEIFNHKAFCVVIENINNLIDVILNEINCNDVLVDVCKDSIVIKGESNDICYKLYIDYYADDDCINYCFSRTDYNSKERRFKNYSVNIGEDNSLNFEIDRNQFCNNNTKGISIESLKYNNDGIMIKRDYKRYTARMLEDISCLSNNSIKSSRNNYILFTNRFDFHVSLIRKFLDVALFNVETDDSNYNSYIVLDSSNGLRDMRLLNDEFKTPKNVEICPLSISEIDDLINDDCNSDIVKNALFSYSDGRDEFLYDSSLDDNFICSGHFNGELDNLPIKEFTKKYQGSNVN